MPRRNNRGKHTWHEPLQRENEPDKPRTYEAMARDLVRRGLASPLILDGRRKPDHEDGGISPAA